MDREHTYKDTNFDTVSCVPSCIFIFLNHTISVMRKTSYDELRKEFDKREEECNGSWKVISSNPDSIFINAKGHVLHGKYRVLFITDSIGYVAKYPVDYIILENDSTHLCMTRVE